jgi:hypothetical protein
VEAEVACAFAGTAFAFDAEAATGTATLLPKLVCVALAAGTTLAASDGTAPPAGKDLPPKDWTFAAVVD